MACDGGLPPPLPFGVTSGISFRICSLRGRTIPIVGNYAPLTPRPLQGAKGGKHITSGYPISTSRMQLVIHSTYISVPRTKDFVA